MATDQDPRPESSNLPDTRLDAMGMVKRLGNFPDDLIFMLTEVSERVVTTEKKGAVVATFDINKVKGQPAVTIGVKLKERMPEGDESGAVVYAVGDGFLHRDDPRQTVMEFRVVTPDDGSARRLEATEDAVRKVQD